MATFVLHMKKITILTLMFGCLALWGQTERVLLKWGDPIRWDTGQLDTPIYIPSFDKEHFSYDETQGLRYHWQQKGVSTSYDIQNVVYAPMTPEELKNMERSSIPSDIQLQSQVSNARSRQFSSISFSPIIKEGNSYKKVISFDLVSNTKKNKSVQSRGAKSFAGAVINSLLATGQWFRFKVDKTGVYRINAEFLQSLGMDLSSVDPATIKIYGSGGRLEDLDNKEIPRYTLIENPTEIVGIEDGTFSGNDHIRFYGIGTEGYNQQYDTNINPYTESAYYYVTAGGNPAKRIQNYIEPTQNSSLNITTFDSYKFHEVDEKSIGGVGRRWFEEAFRTQSSRTFSFDFRNRVLTEPIQLRILAGARSSRPSAITVSANGQEVGIMNINQVNPNSVGRGGSIIQGIDLAGTRSEIDVQLDFNTNGVPNALGFIDFIGVTAKEQLIGSDIQFEFQNLDVASEPGVGTYQVQNASSINAVWDITDLENISKISNNGSATLAFKAGLGENRRYQAVVNGDLYLPQVPEDGAVVENQNLKGTLLQDNAGNFADLDYLLITNSALIPSGIRLAEHHNANGLRAKVVDVAQIYKEFGSGNRDIAAIRDLVRYLYENASAPERRLKYVCFLGDASYDYRDRIQDNNNIVPTYQSFESFSLVSSYMTDDFYGMMDPGEGKLKGSDKLDIAVGRILVDTPELANGVIDKILTYYSEASLGRWRNRYLYVSDDVDDDWEGQIQESLNAEADRVTDLVPGSNMIKIIGDSFKQEVQSGGERYPEVQRQILSNIDAGCLVFNYFGHGGEDGLSQENFFDLSSINALTNTDKYPMIMTVTCEFTKFDNPGRITAGEEVFWRKEAGVSSMITTTRQVTVGTGINFNQEITEWLFPENLQYTSIAEALRLAKNNLPNSNSKRAVFYIGDPAMRLAIPSTDIRLTAINDKPLNEQTEPIQALSKVKLSGEVVINGSVATNYNGVVATTIFDKTINRKTLANDGIRLNGELILLEFKDKGGTIYRGKASVTSGLFDIEFVVPRDIQVSPGEGTVIFYAQNQELNADNAGRNTELVIGGINENAPEDNEGPQVDVFLNDESFISGGITNSSPVLLVNLEDTNGINTASGIGHDIIAILDGNEKEPIVLNDFYETEIDDFTKGSINFKLRDLEPGEHTLLVRAWDVYNNSSVQEITFIVASDENLTLTNVLNYPNPFIDFTNFWFTHSGSPSEALEVQVQVYTITGKVVWTNNQTLSGKSTYRDEINWNGKDDFGDRIGKGVYVYKILVKSTLTNKTAEKMEKLVIL